MTNTELLIKELESKGYSQRSFCKAAGFNKNTFNAKANNRAKFDSDEITLICDILNINSAKKKCNIFLSEASQK